MELRLRLFALDGKSDLVGLDQARERRKREGSTATLSKRIVTLFILISKLPPTDLI